MADFAKKLLIFRVRRGMSQSDLARATGLQPSAISHFEKGRRSPSMNNLDRLAKVLEVPIDDLVGRPYPIIHPLMNAFHRMTQRDREVLVELAEMLAKKNESGLTKSVPEGDGGRGR